jgi:NTE family protein
VNGEPENAERYLTMTDTSSGNQQSIDKPYVVLALQGGGAMGAFQVGAYKALSEKGYEPDWVAGISIGAVNASIIAGNKREDRLVRLEKFWSTVAGHLDCWERFPNFYSEKLTNQWKVWMSMVGGVPGFFRPNYIPPLFAPANSPQAGSLFDPQELKKTLGRLISLPVQNDQESADHVRLTLGATDVWQGEPKIFENFGPNKVPITADHIMASGAFAPSFPGVVINGRHYWDGGVSSNSSVRHILHHLNELTQSKHVLVFAIDLWSHGNLEPKSFDEVCWRSKQINFSSRLRHEIKNGKTFLDNEKLKAQATAGGTEPQWKGVDIVRVSYQSEPSQIPWDDALFSRSAIEGRIRKGHAAMSEQLDKHPHPWHPEGKKERVTTHYC